MEDRLRHAERAAEREFQQSSSNSEESTTEKFGKNSGLKSKKKRKKIGKFIVKNKRAIFRSAEDLKNKRKKRRMEQKIKSCHEKYVGPVGTVVERYVGASSEKRDFDMKCPMCDQEVTRLQQHLVLQHQMDEQDAKLKTSEMRVMFLWSRKSKHGVPRPLPCSICNTWMLRLDTHLVRKHKLEKKEANEILKKARMNTWATSSITSTSTVKEHIPSHPKLSSNQIKEAYLQSDLGPEYVPPNAKVVTPELLKEWGCINDDFKIYYENGDLLLDAFKVELSLKKDKHQADQFKRHVEYIWSIVDSSKVTLPKSALGNTLLLEDKYHNPTYSLIGKGGNEASSLRVRFTALRALVRFLRRRKVYGGMSRACMSSLLEYVEEWNGDLTDPISQRKTDLRKLKLKRLMTPSHMIRYGRSKHVQNLNKQMLQIDKTKITTRFAQQGRDSILSNLCIMNGLRASNIIELRCEDIDEAKPAEGYPGYTSFTNAQYKTSTIYGEKVIVLPNSLFNFLKIYKEKLRPALAPQSERYLFVSKDSEKMSHGAIGSALTSSFKNADVFGADEYQRVCPTRIRISCATFGCKKEGIDSGYFAKYFMKNKEDTTNTYYNLFSNHREALKLAMLMGDTFHVGEEVRTIKEEEVENLTKAIYDSEKRMPTKDEIIAWVKKHADVDSKVKESVCSVIINSKMSLFKLVDVT